MHKALRCLFFLDLFFADTGATGAQTVCLICRSGKTEDLPLIVSLQRETIGAIYPVSHANGRSLNRFRLGTGGDTSVRTTASCVPSHQSQWRTNQLFPRPAAIKSPSPVMRSNNQNHLSIRALLTISIRASLMSRISNAFTGEFVSSPYARQCTDKVNQQTRLENHLRLLGHVLYLLSHPLQRRPGADDEPDFGA